jgi:hypothetical protein
MFFYFFCINRNCIKDSKSTIDDVQLILKLLNHNETLSKSQTSKTTVLIVVNEITTIIFSDNESSTTIPEGFYFFCLF